jgi:hypothetical protein
MRLEFFQLGYTVQFLYVWGMRTTRGPRVKIHTHTQKNRQSTVPRAFECIKAKIVIKRYVQYNPRACTAQIFHTHKHTCTEQGRTFVTYYKEEGYWKSHIFKHLAGH